MPEQIDVRELRGHCEAVLLAVLSGQPLVIVDGERPLSRLLPCIDGPARVAGLHRGMIWTSDDFDAELPDEFWFGES